jgi:hypothetical protein
MNLKTPRKQVLQTNYELENSTTPRKRVLQTNYELENSTQIQTT